MEDIFTRARQDIPADASSQAISARNGISRSYDTGSFSPSRFANIPRFTSPDTSRLPAEQLTRVRHTCSLCNRTSPT